MNTIEAIQERLRAIDLIDEFTDDFVVEELSSFYSSRDVVEDGNEAEDTDRNGKSNPKLKELSDTLGKQDIYVDKQKIIDNLIQKIQEVNKKRRIIYKKTKRISTQLKEIQKTRALWEDLENKGMFIASLWIYL